MREPLPGKGSGCEDGRSVELGSGVEYPGVPDDKGNREYDQREHRDHRSVLLPEGHFLFCVPSEHRFIPEVLAPVERPLFDGRRRWFLHSLWHCEAWAPAQIVLSHGRTPFWVFEKLSLFVPE
jgi:hypothetical protein